ncbi:MAG: CYTH and CHAD domain-containing protein [Nitrospiraceae bacterium]
MPIAQKETLEREIKLHVPRRFSLPRLPGEPLVPHTFTSTYYDTETFRLAKAGITLRYRTEMRKGVWQLKLPLDEARLELEFEGGRGSVPESVKKVLFAHLRGHELRPIAKLRTRRTGMRVRDVEGALADVVVDSVSALDGRRVIRHFQELEVELTGGDEKALHRIEKALRGAGAQDGDHRPKVFQALGLPSTVPAIEVEPTAPPSDHVKAMLQEQVRSLLRHDPGIRLGTDPEYLHQARVATRRLRAYLRATCAMFAHDWVEGLRAELSWLGNVLGPVRDLDVLLDYLRTESGSLTLPERRAFEKLITVVEEERTTARSAMMEALESEPYLAFVERIESAAQSPAVVDPNVSLIAIAQAAFKKLCRAVREAEPSAAEATDEALHRIRIKGKRARYTAELAEALCGKPAKRFIRQSKAFQDLLGQHQDAIVAEQRLRKLLNPKPGALAAFALGRLIERQDGHRRQARAALAKAWSKLEKRGQKAW